MTLQPLFYLRCSISHATKYENHIWICNFLDTLLNNRFSYEYNFTNVISKKNKLSKALFTCKGLISLPRLHLLVQSFVYSQTGEKVRIFRKFSLSLPKFGFSTKYRCSHLGPLRLHRNSIEVKTNCHFQNFTSKKTMRSFSPRKRRKTAHFCRKSAHPLIGIKIIPFSLRRCGKYMYTLIR